MELIKKYLPTILVVIIVVIASLFLFTKYQSCNQPQTGTTSRDSINQVKIDELEKKFSTTESKLQTYDSVFLNIEFVRQGDKVHYVEKNKDAEKLPANENLKKLRERLKYE